MKLLTLLLLLSVSLSVGQTIKNILPKGGDTIIVLSDFRPSPTVLKSKYDSLEYRYQSALKIAREKAKEVSSLKQLNQNNLSAIIEQAEEIKRLQRTIDSLKVCK